MNDEELGEVLRSLLAAADPVPPASLQAAHETIGWRDPDSELALLASESAPQPAHLRGGRSRLLTFHTEGIVVDLEVSEEDGTVQLLGQLDPPQTADVTVESAGGSRATQADNQGRFAADGLRSGWIRVVITSRTAGGTRTATEWFHA